MVKAIVFNKFLQIIQEDGDMTKTLAFSCWCDGGPYEEPEYRQHRHMIIVAPKGHFESNFWPQIELIQEQRPCQNYL